MDENRVIEAPETNDVEIQNSVSSQPGWVHSHSASSPLAAAAESTQNAGSALIFKAVTFNNLLQWIFLQTARACHLSRISAKANGERILVCAQAP